MPPRDEDCLEAAIQGDEKAFSALVSRFGDQVRASLAGRISEQWRSVLDEDDVLQVTYMEAFLEIRDLRPAGINAFVGWLKRIAERNLQDAIRNLSAAKRPDPARRIQPVSRDESAVALYDLLNGDSQTPSRVAAGIERQSILWHAVDRLPPLYRDVVTAYDLESKPVAEVAAAIGKSTGATFMLRARALDRLRVLLPQSMELLSRAH